MIYFSFSILINSGLGSFNVSPTLSFPNSSIDSRVDSVVLSCLNISSEVGVLFNSFDSLLKLSITSAPPRKPGIDFSYS